MVPTNVSFFSDFSRIQVLFPLLQTANGFVERLFLPFLRNTSHCDCHHKRIRLRGDDCVKITEIFDIIATYFPCRIERRQRRVYFGQIIFMCWWCFHFQPQGTI